MFINHVCVSLSLSIQRKFLNWRRYDMETLYRQTSGTPYSRQWTEWFAFYFKGRDTLLAYSLAFYNDLKLFIVLKNNAGVISR